GNTRIVNDGVTTSGSTAISSASAAFTAADVGKRIDIATTNASGVATLVVSTTIAAFVSATQVTLAKAAGDLPAGVYYSGTALPAITKPIALFGHSA
ncbi:transmembrane protein, putative, partial [Medicago truncatula]